MTFVFWGFYSSAASTVVANLFLWLDVNQVQKFR